MADIADLFGKASIDTDHSVATTVTADRSAGVTVLNCFDLSTFTEDTPVFFVTYTKTTDPLTSEVVISNLVSWKGLVNAGANTVTNLTVAPGYVDAGNTTGQFVECIPTSYWSNSLMDGLLTSLNPDGTLNDTAMGRIYPVGSVYINATNNTNPATLLGFGTWVAFGAGRVPVGFDSGQSEFDTLEETGGAKTHTLTIPEMPSHTHTQNAHNHQQQVATTGGAGTGITGTASLVGNTGSNQNTVNNTATNQNTGGGGAHNNLQPYIVVHMWKRTA